MNLPLSCIVCGKELLSALGSDTEDTINQPAGGTAFTTRGHYGSTVFDPMDDTFLEVNICDEDLLAAASRGRVLRGRPDRPVYTPPHYEPFQPDTD